MRDAYWRVYRVTGDERKSFGRGNGPGMLGWAIARAMDEEAPHYAVEVEWVPRRRVTDDNYSVA